MTTPINFGQAVQWIKENPYTLITNKNSKINRLANLALTPLRSLQMDKPWSAFCSHSRVAYEVEHDFRPINRALAVLLVIPATVVAVAAKVFNAWYNPEIREQMDDINFLREVERTTEPQILDLAGGAENVQQVRIFEGAKEYGSPKNMRDHADEIFRSGERAVRGNGDKPFYLFLYLDKTSDTSEVALIFKDPSWEVKFSGTHPFKGEILDRTNKSLDFCKKLLNDESIQVDGKRYELGEY